jgi:signal transduction histidine kinase
VKPLSIRLRLSLMVLILTLAIIAVLSIAAYIEFEESLLGNTDDTLTAMAEGMRATLDGQDSRENLDAEFQAIVGYDESGQQTRYRIWADGNDENMFPIGSPDALKDRLLYPPVEEQPDVGESSLFNLSRKMEDGKTIFRVIWLRFARDQRVVNVLVARSCGYVYHELGEFLGLLLMVGGSVILLTALLVPILVSHGLRAITDTGAGLGQITHRSLKTDGDIRPDVPIELRPFKSALQEMLSRLHKAMQQQERLTADAAHELRTPLAIIKSTLQTMRIRARPAIEYEEGIDDTLKDVDRMEHLIGQFLSLARLDAADTVRNPMDIRLDTLLESLTDIFRDRAEQLGGQVVCTNSVPVSVQGDEMELRQLFSNLLDNAIRYGPPKGRIHVVLEDGPDTWATVCIHDDGGAIPPECLPHLFDRFYRVEPSRSQTSGGSGLGLAIAREIVQRHHGDIAITSDPQTGTSVIVHLCRS